MLSCGSLPKQPQPANLCQARVRIQDLHPGFHIDGRCPSTWGILLLPSRHLVKKLNQKRSNEDPNQHSDTVCQHASIFTQRHTKLYKTFEKLCEQILQKMCTQKLYSVFQKLLRVLSSPPIAFSLKENSVNSPSLSNIILLYCK